MRALNMYAGLGGNRKLWPDYVKVTAVEFNPEIAAIYKEYFPQDEVIIGDAHAYLLKHYKEFDFIWSSPVCKTHSRARMWSSKGGGCEPKYPDMSLYEEIIFLEHYAKGKHVVENVIPYYEPLIKPTVEIDRHLFWSNFRISKTYLSERYCPTDIGSGASAYGFNLSDRKMKTRKDQLIRNLINPELGLHIFNCATGSYQPKVRPTPLFS